MSDQTVFGPKVTVREAADYLRLSKSWLDKLRVVGGGPTFCKIGRRVIYELADLDSWISSGRRATTSSLQGGE